MRPHRRDLSAAWRQTSPLLAAGPWLRRTASPRSARTAQPKTRLHMVRKPSDVAINSEAAAIIFHDGWYYMLVSDGACCAGANSNCDIRIGRSRKATGPFVDNTGVELLPDGGTCSAYRAAGT